MRMHTRGAGDVARSLKMRGEEIWPLLDKNISAMVGKSAYLIRGVADAKHRSREDPS